MEYVNELKINEAVIHILDQNGDDVIYNEFYLDLNNEEVYDFIFKHVSKCLKDENLKYGNFLNNSVVNEYCYKFFRNEEDLLGISRPIAGKLYSIMRKDPSIPSCDLMMVSILSNIGNPLIGIFKMDYIKNYAHKVDFVGEKIGIDIISQFTGLPTSSQKIQKCAFVKPYDENEDVNAYVIDKRSKKTEDSNEEFFIGDFLNCTLKRNQRDDTKDFFSASEKWIRENYSDDAEKSYDIREGIKNKFENENKIDIEDIANEIIPDENLRESFKETIESSGVDKKMEVDKAWVNNKFKRRRLRVDNDIDIYIDEENYKDSDKFEIQKIGDGRINILIKNIEVLIEK